MRIVDIHAHPLLDRLYAPARRESRPGSDRLSLDALRAGQVAVVVSSIYPNWCPARGSACMARCCDILDRVEAHLAAQGDGTAVVADADGLDCALAQGKIAFIHAVEGGHVLQGRPENLATLYAWGVRSLTLTHFLNKTARPPAPLTRADSWRDAAG